MKIRAASLVIALCATLAPKAEAAVFYPTTFTLDNGLQIVVVPNHLTPAVNQMVWYKVGSTDEVPGKTGLAHYLEHLMFRGTKNIPPDAFSKLIAAQGGNDNAFTSYDYTAFYETIASDRLEMVMQMEAERMQNLQILPATATPELSVVLNERQERTDNNPQGKFEEKMRHTLLPQYPYGIPVIGWKPEIEKLSVADAQGFYASHYAPDNAIVIISGDVDPGEVKTLATKIYGPIPRHDIEPRRHLLPPPDPRRREFVMTDPGVEQAQLEWEAPVPSYQTQRDNEAYAFEVLSEALDSGEVGLLYRDLVATQAIASGVGSSYDPDTRGPSIFTIEATPTPGRKPNDLERALKAELKSLAQNGLDDATVEAAKDRLQRDAIFARDSLVMPGYAFGSALATGHTVDDVEEWPNRIHAVTTDQVNAALKHLASTPKSVIGLLLPDPHASQKAKDAAHPMSHDMSIR